MNFAFTDEQEEVRRTVRRWLEENQPLQHVRQIVESATRSDDRLCKRAAVELGLQGMRLPERYGGQGLSLVEVGIVLEEMGRAMFCGPFFAVCLATEAILAAASEEQQDRLLPQILSGDLVATVALGEGEGAWDPAAIATQAVREGSSYRVSGTKTLVPDGDLADVIVVPARGAADGRVSLCLVERNAEGLAIEELPVLDRTRPMSRLTLRGVRAEVLGDPTDGAHSLDRTLNRASALVAVETLGVGQRCLDMAVDYAKQRIQFGRPIGSFQAIKHKCADLLTELEAARSAAYWALWAAGDGENELPIAASVAKAACSTAAVHAATENIQIHGGIGFTWEHDAHLFFRRAHSSALLLGDPSYHRRRLVELLWKQV